LQTAVNLQQLLSSQVMLDFAVSKNSDVRESAVKVIERLITFIHWYLVIKVRHKEFSTLSCIPEHPAMQGCLRGNPQRT